MSPFTDGKHTFEAPPLGKATQTKSTRVSTLKEPPAHMTGTRALQWLMLCDFQKMKARAKMVFAYSEMVLGF